MPDWEKILFTSATTIVGGIIVLVCGQLLQRFLIDPVIDQSKIIGEITYSLIYYANVYAIVPTGLVTSVPGETRKEGSGVDDRTYYCSDI